MRAAKLAENNFAFLLGGLLLFLVAVPSLRLFLGVTVNVGVMREGLLVGFSLLTLISVWSLQERRGTFRFGLVLSLLLTLLAFVGHHYHSHVVLLCAGLILIAFSVLSCVIAVQDVFGWRKADTNILMGAVCIYLLLGLIWAILYAMFAILWPEASFSGLQYEENRLQFDSFLYFSFVTLTTAGYGDITPVNPLIRTLAYLEMITGQFYMAVLVAGLVGLFMRQRNPR